MNTYSPNFPFYLISKTIRENHSMMQYLTHNHNYFQILTNIQHVLYKNIGGVLRPDRADLEKCKASLQN